MSDRSRKSNDGGCPVCGGTRLNPVLQTGPVPVFCNVLHGSRSEALAAPKGGIDLALCTECGHLHNTAFDPTLVRYAPGYENALHHSRVFRTYASELTQRLVRTYGLTDKVIVDIGCGDGDFLRQLCRAGGSSGYGFDPSLDRIASFSESGRTVRLINAPYGPAFRDLVVDFAACRHVLEHLRAPGALLDDIRTTLEQGAEVNLYFEVPSAGYMVRSGAIWDVIYEHCGYFSASSLTRLFGDHGFAVTSIGDCFGGQYLGIELRLCSSDVGSGRDDSEEIGRYAEACRGFATTWGDTIALWRDRLAMWAGEGKSAAIWGAGSKGVAFLNAMHPCENILSAVDLNPNKHERFVPGTGHPVIAPETLRHVAPDFIIIMNRIYAAEIARSLDLLGIESEIVCVDEAAVAA